MKLMVVLGCLTLSAVANAQAQLLSENLSDYDAARYIASYLPVCLSGMPKTLPKWLPRHVLELCNCMAERQARTVITSDNMNGYPLSDKQEAMFNKINGDCYEAMLSEYPNLAN